MVLRRDVQTVVVLIFGLDSEHAVLVQVLLQQTIEAEIGLAVQRLEGRTKGEDVLVAVVGAIEVVTLLLFPEIPGSASCDHQLARILDRSGLAKRFAIEQTE